MPVIKPPISSPLWWKSPVIDLTNVPAIVWVGRSDGTHLVAQRYVLAVLEGQTLGPLVVVGELQCSLTALGQQRPVRQEGAVLPRRRVDAGVLLQGKHRQRRRGS